MDPITLLNELRDSWHITLTNEGDLWRLSLELDGRAHVYRGADLARVVRAAWAGEPSGRVS